MIMSDGEISDKGIVEYAVVFAREFDYRFEKNYKKINGKELLKISYVKKIIKELFDISIEIEGFDFTIEDKYLEITNIESIVRDVYYLYLDKILYNEKDNTYLAYIYKSGVNYTNKRLSNEELEEVMYSGRIIRYKKNNNSVNTILEYKEI